MSWLGSSYGDNGDQVIFCAIKFNANGDSDDSMATLVMALMHWNSIGDDDFSGLLMFTKVVSWEQWWSIGTNGVIQIGDSGANGSPMMSLVPMKNGKNGANGNNDANGVILALTKIQS